MQKQDYAGLSRTFDMYYPDVKQLVKETEQFYNSTYTDTERWRLDSYDNVRLIGTFTLNKSDHDVTLPRLYFKKEAEMTNPTFYVVTRPAPQDKERIIHIGTSVEAAVPYACSVSALTGGILPHIEKSRAFSVYLKIMSYVKKYGYCTVYEIQSGYDDICIRGINGTTYAKEAFSKQIFNFVNCDNNGKRFNDDFFLSPEERVQKQKQSYRDNNIWDAVVSFKTMVNTKPEILDALAKLSDPVMKKCNGNQQEATDSQEITIYYYGDSLVFNFKNKVSVMSPEDCESNKEAEFERFITPSAKILCQTGDTVYEKYTAFVAHKVKTNDRPNEQAARKLIKKQSDFSSFEQTVIDAFPDCKHIEYQNIYLGEIEHKIKNYSLLNDGAGSRITIDTKKMPDIASIRSVVCAIYGLFDLDLGLTKTMLCF